MTKRIKKMPVRPEMRRQWLQRYEEEGESPPQIAKADGYDVRTVRKQIDLERQERERREARSIVLRRALEQHYADLCAFAQKLASQLTIEGGTLLTLRDDRMWSALREHLPRSVIWKSLDRWEHIQSQIGQLESEMAKSFEQQVKSRSPLNFVTPPQDIGFSKGVVSALTFQCKVVAQEQPGLLSRADFKLSQLAGQVTDMQLGAFHIGKVPNDQVADTQNLVKGLLDEVTNWSSYYELEQLYAELKRIQGVLEDELAIITLRRVVPSRCKYCPI